MRRNVPLLSMIQQMTRTNQSQQTAPRAGVDFQLETPDQVVPGSHPLPLRGATMSSLRWPLVSPYMPSPQRVHPYFQGPIPELPHIECSVPIVYTRRTIKVPIVVPVFNLENEITHTLSLDPHVFGRYPNTQHLHKWYEYWDQRCQDFKIQWDYNTREVYKSNKKDWPAAGSGMKRAGARKDAKYSWGAPNKSTKPWDRRMPQQRPMQWRDANCMALTTKLLQGKLQVVERLTLSEPTTESFKDLCRKMQWDTRHTGAGVLFIDGGSRVAPTKEFDRNFFYGSFINGRAKLVRPTLNCEDPVDWNKMRQRLKYLGPKGPKNPVPLNRFNVYDCFEHDRVVITEGAIEQIQSELLMFKYLELPPHIRNQLPASALERRGVMTIEEEVAGRVEEAEMKMYDGYYDNPYAPWSDEDQAVYEVKPEDNRIVRKVVSSDGTAKDGSWRLLE